MRPWRGERDIAAFVFERNVHGILSDHHGGIEVGYRFRETASEHLEPLIMLVKAEHNEDCRGIGTQPVGRFHRHDLVRTVKAQFLVESFCCRNGAEQALRRGVEVVGRDVLGAVLKIRDGGILVIGSSAAWAGVPARPQKAMSSAMKMEGMAFSYTDRWELSREREELMANS